MGSHRSQSRMARMRAGQTPPKSAAGHDPVKPHPENKNPRGRPRGKRIVVLEGYAGSRWSNLLCRPVTLGLLSFGGAVIRIQPFICWVEPLRLETCEPASPLLRGLGACSEAINIRSAAR